MKLSKMTIAAIILALVFWGYDEFKPYFSGESKPPVSTDVPQK